MKIKGFKKIKFTELARVFPSEKFKKYLEEFGVIDENNLDAKSIEEMFLTLRADFIKGILDLDDFALMCNSLQWMMVKRHHDDDNPSLTNVLEGVNELSFDIRTNKSEVLKFLPDRVKMILDYKPESGSALHGSSAPTKNFYH